MADTSGALTKPSPSWLDRAARQPFLAILLVALVGWASGLMSLPPLDRDESRFAEASRQMVETGNYVDIRFANVPRYNKPVGIYWLQAGSAQLWGMEFRGRIWVYRLPSWLGGLLASWFLYVLARSIAPPATALIASLLLETTLLLTGESTIATTDAALLATVIAAQYALMRVYLAARGRSAPSRILILGGWAAVGAGLLIKGPVILAVLGATAFALSLWDRDWRWLAGTRPLLGAALAIVMVAPWASAIALASHGAFYQQSLGHDFAGKILSGEESHGAPPGYYLALASVTLWPAILFVLPALALAIKNRAEPATRYLLAWSGATWLLFELVPTKLPHYILPAYPALALLAALWITGLREGSERRWDCILRHAACVVFAVVLVALAAICVILPERLGGATGPIELTGAAVGLVMGCAAIIFLLRHERLTAAGAALMCGLVFYPVLALGVAPQLHEIWLSPRAAELVAGHRGVSDHAPVVLDGYVEPSLVFLLGSNTQIGTAGNAAEAAEASGLALVENRVQSRFLTDLRSRGDGAAPLGEVSGLDYSTGRQQHVTLYRVTRINPGKPDS
ncbi:MAG TPA: glycosyltransferase family 39 protein [Rhizomicrobium sp.]|jgi:4-amino-4-deoxy-L-arabinose transferase-like glycosyltransferase